MSAIQPEEIAREVPIERTLEKMLSSFDGLSTLLGAVETWSQVLKTTLNILFNANCPMILVWSCDRLLFYNDAYSTLLSEANSHLVFGEPINRNLSKLANDISSDVEQVFLTGQSLQRQNQPFLTHQSSQSTPIYTWSYSPLWDEVGQVGGVFATGVRVIPQKTTTANGTQDTVNKDKLRQQEEQVRRLINAFPVLIAYIDKDHYYRFNNQTYETWFGQPITYFTDRHLRDVLGEKAYQVLHPYIEQALSGLRVSYEGQIPYQAGETRYVRAEYIPHINPQGDVEGYFSLVSDISEQKLIEAERQQAEQALWKSEERFRFVTYAVKGLVFDWDLQTNEVYRSDKLYNLLGIYPEEAPTTAIWWHERIHPDDVVRLQPQMTELFASTEHLYEAEYRIRHQDGHWVDVWEQGYLIRNEQGQVIRIVGSTVDISDRKQTELALREKEQQLQQLSDSMPQFVWICSATGDLEYSNQQWLEFSGFTLDQTRDRTLLATLYHPDDRSWVFEQWTTALETQQSFEVEARLRRSSDGAYRWFLIRAVPGFNDRGQVLHWYGTSTDIHDRTQALQALRDSEQRLQMALEGSGGGLWDWNITTDEVYMSPPWLEMLGYGARDLPGNFQAWERLVHPDDKAWVLERMQAHLQDDTVPYKFEYRLLSKSGEWKWIATYGKVVMRDERGQPLRMAGIHHDMSDRKQAELALQSSEERLKLASRAAQIGTFEWNIQTNEVFWTEEQECLYGLPPNGFPGRYEYWRQFIHPQDVETIEAAVQEAAVQGTDLGIEFRIVRADGEIRWIAARCQAFHDEKGKPLRMIGVNEDITEQKQAKTALLDSEQRFRRVFECNMVPMGIWSHSGEILQANDALLDLIGYTREELETGQINWLTLTPLEWSSLDELAIVEIADRGSSIPFEKEYIHKQGHRIPILMGGASFLDGSKSGVFFAIDLTERKQIEEALRTSEERLRFAVEGAALGTWEYNLVSQQMIWSERTKIVFGVPLDAEVDYKRFINTLHPDDRDRVHATIQHAIAQQETYDIEMRSVWADGSVRWMRSIGRARYDNNGVPTRTIGVVLDITNRKQAEEDLRESERRFRRLVESNLFGVAFGDFAGRIWKANDYFLNLIGYTREEIETENLQWTDITPPDFQALDEKAKAELRIKGVATPFEKEFIRKDGSRVPILIGSTLLQEPYDRQQEIIGFFIDITERKQAEVEQEKLLRQTQAAREEAERANRIKDEFLAVLSHELRSPLNPILGWSKLLQTRSFNPQATQRALETIERNAKLQAQLIEDLLDVSRILRGKMALNICPTNLVTVIESALETVRLAAEAKQLKIHTFFAADRVQTLGDSARLQQVVWNLLSNAVKFTPDGGQVDVSLNLISSYAYIQVKDTGKGISAEFLPYVFDYFRQEDGKTTRKFGGLGLGLAIVRYLTELHGGTVQAESAGEGQGATFEVRLPLIANVTESSSRNVSSSISPSNLSQLNILVVDDQEDMRDLVQVILEQQDVQVRIATSATEALMMFDRQLPDLLISDIGMPEIDGYALLQQIRLRSPEQGGLVPAIALTAYAGEYDHQQALKAGFQKHLPKPIEPEILINAILQLISNQKSADSSRG